MAKSFYQKQLKPCPWLLSRKNWWNVAAITLAETKAYLRVDNIVEDDLITKLIGSATATVENVLRQPLSAFDPLPDNIHTAILYTIAYLYEYRETADFDAMIKFLRAILAPYRKEEF